MNYIDELIEYHKSEIHLLKDVMNYANTHVLEHLRTDYVYDHYRSLYPEDNISKMRFTKLVCKLLNLESVQCSLDGVRCYVYEHL